MRKLGFFALLLLAGLWACEYENIVPIVVEVPDNVKFSVDVAPIFADVSCTVCHGGGTPPNLTQGEAREALVSGGFVDIDNPVGSKLILMINEGHGTSGDLSAEQKAYILKWITEGAKNN